MQNRLAPLYALRARGFSIIELLIAMTISVVLLAGVVTLFANSRKTYETTDHMSRIQENGRFALDQIARDLRSAGYLGCAKQAPFQNALNNNTTLRWNFQNPVEGFESTGGAWAPAIDPIVINPAAINSDVLTIRTPDPDAASQRLFSAMVSSTDDLQITPPATAPFKDGDVVMITDCNATSVFQVTSYAAGIIQHNGGGAAPGNSTADLGYVYQAGATLLPVRTVIYYIRQSANASHGANFNSLWRIVGTGAPEELVEGVDSLQVLYGRDTNGDRLVDDGADGVNGYVPADQIADWSTVISVRIGLLVRALDEYGKNPDVAHDVIGVNVPAAGDNRDRLVFTSTIALRNKAF
jgi:type IV pilus assembly protein PilW